jgi:DNA-binding MarR family transcriptional regulator
MTTSRIRFLLQVWHSPLSHDKLNAVQEFQMTQDSAARTRAGLLDRDRYLPGYLLKLANGMSRSASRAFLSLFDVGVIEWRILSILCIESNVTAQHICTTIALDRAAASRSLSILNKKGLVLLADHLTDNRKRPITITRKGKVLHDKMLAIAVRRQNILTEGLSEPEIDVLLSLLRRLVANLENVFEHDARLVAAGTKRATSHPATRRRTTH